MEDFFEAGGMPALLGRARPTCSHVDALTVTGDADPRRRGTAA